MSQLRKPGDRRSRRWVVHYGDIVDRLSKEDIQEKFGMLRKTRKFCSSPICCGNPRRMKGQNELTIKESFYEDDLEEFEAVKIKL